MNPHPIYLYIFLYFLILIVGTVLCLCSAITICCRLDWCQGLYQTEKTSTVWDSTSGLFSSRNSQNLKSLRAFITGSFKHLLLVLDLWGINFREPRIVQKMYGNSTVPKGSKHTTYIAIDFVMCVQVKQQIYYGKKKKQKPLCLSISQFFIFFTDTDCRVNEQFMQFVPFAWVIGIIEVFSSRAKHIGEEKKSEWCVLSEGEWFFTVLLLYSYLARFSKTKEI